MEGEGGEGERGQEDSCTVLKMEEEEGGEEECDESGISMEGYCAFARAFNSARICCRCSTSYTLITCTCMHCVVHTRP